MASTVDHIRRVLEAEFQPEHLEILDESAQHAGHAGAAAGGGHYRVTIVSSRFESLSPIARHRLVNETLSDLLRSDIHALALTTRAPGERQG